MNKRLTLFLLIVLLTLALNGCAPSSTATMSPPSAPSVAESQRNAAPASKAGDSFAGAAGQGVNAPAAQPQQQSGSEPKRLVIRNANLTIVVDDPGQAMDAVTRMTEAMSGFVVTSNLYKTTTVRDKEVPEANITVRVPAEKLNDALGQVKKLVKDPNKDVKSETISGQDVTKEYTDLQSRLINLQQAEAQMREIMASATKTEDVLSVYNQLTQIREQIEVIKGQIKYYEESSLMSSIAIVIQAQAAVQPLEVGGWQPVGVARNAVQALIDTMQVIGNAAIWLGLFVLPVGLVIFLPLRLLWWLLRRNRKAPKAPTAAPPAAPQTNL